MSALSTKPKAEDVEAVDRFEAAMGRIAPFMLTSLKRQRQIFGGVWTAEFGETLRRFVATDDEKLEWAVKGYVNFALDGMRLQKRFEKTRVYDNKTYDEAASSVYHNKEYMFNLYLPGILLSHYLWPHHYRQFQFYKQKFLPTFLGADQREFCDIGPGTGFYSRQLLSEAADARGAAFDISASALEFSTLQVSAFDLSDNFTTHKRDIITQPSDRQWPFLVCIEVLEHLEDPLTFLRALRGMLAPGGKGLISAAVTAPNEDHIYLYNSGEEVRRQLEQAGFTVLDSQEDKAYEPKADEPVPVNAAFIVTP